LVDSVRFAVLAKRLVKVPVVPKKFVLVAAVVVVFTKPPRNWSVPRVEVALMRASARAFVKYRFVPSATLVVRRPRVEVESCWYAPPAYEPRRMPAAVGLVMPVPPLPAAKDPIHEGVRVWTFAAEVIVRPRLVSEVVAKV